MQEEVVLSVIVPIYNAERTICQCVDSILKTNLDNIEIILVDDGSSDASAGICDEYSLKHNNIRTFHIANSGVSAARNVGLENAKGKYVGFVDSDDWIEPDMFDLMYKALVEHRAQIVSCEFFLEYPPFVVQDEKIEKEFELNSEIFTRVEAAHQLALGQIGGFCWNKLFQKDLIKDVFNTSFAQAEDLLFVAAYVLEIDRLVHLKAPLYHYRQKDKEEGKIPNHATKGAYEKVIELYRVHFKSSAKDVRINFFRQGRYGAYVYKGF